jgi:GTPase KRas protein
LVYNVTSLVSFHRIEAFRQAVLRVKRGTETLVLVGNKCDMENKREVTKELRS